MYVFPFLARLPLSSREKSYSNCKCQINKKERNDFFLTEDYSQNFERRGTKKQGDVSLLTNKQTSHSLPFAQDRFKSEREMFLDQHQTKIKWAQEGGHVDPFTM
eukprot:TRINITY_DN7975_c0_g1_i1.p1 TRINITY_DN7975_c0_g1~~TRINITY_DN7975_c0_g1_i1.p1  ORF type:complete len:104 (-),score=22.76 TRINITY_DN7975_c0_g1_i1:212-523(-)